MRISLPYKEESIIVTMDDKHNAGVFYPNEVPDKDETQLTLNALDKPLGNLSWEEFTDGGDGILVIVNDATRPTPTSKLLEILTRRCSLDRFTFLIATGSHKASDDAELEWIFGPLMSKIPRDKIICHDAKDSSQLADFGKTERGNPLQFNKLVKEFGKILVVTTVEPHYFAGFTGGRKSLLPGVAGYETITANHKLALEPEAATLKLKGNPVHDEMDDCLKKFKDKQIFTIQAVLNRNRNLYSVSAGDIRLAFSDAVTRATEVFCVKIRERTDVVVTVAPYPMDIDLYQSQKALENAKTAVKQDGIIILVSSCRKGIGPETFYQLMSSCDTPGQVMNKLKSGYKLGYHKAAKMIETGMLARVKAFTDLPDEQLRPIFIEPCDSLQSAIDQAIHDCGLESTVCFLPEGSITVPIVG